MAKIRILFLFVLIISSCSLNQKSNNCDCCKEVYTEIDNALNCILNSPNINTTADPRLLLFAIVKGNLNVNQQRGWNIITDSEITDIAKKKYLLITTDKKTINNSGRKLPPEFIDILEKQGKGIQYIITNQSLYPIADWTNSQSKEIIIDRLKIGNGP